MRSGGSPRGSLAALCAIFMLAGVAIGHEHGGGWLAAAVPGVGGDDEATATAPAATATDGRTAPAQRTVSIPPAAPGPDADAPGDGRITVTAVGDTMMGSPPFRMPPDDAGDLFSRVEPLLDGDLVLANLEGTLSTTDASKCPALGPDPSEEERDRAASCFAFQSPPAYASRLAEAGVTVVNLANNHSHDFGPSGLEETTAALEDAGVGYTGLRDTVAVAEAAGRTVAVLGFAPYEWADPLLDPEDAAARVVAAGEEADIVVVTFHGGAEGRAATRVPDGPETHLGEERGDLRAFARTVVDAGADLVIGHGPHVLRGMEVYRGRLVAYSLGNFTAYGGAFNLAGALSESMVLRATLGPDGGLVAGRIVPTVLDDDGAPAPGGDAVATVAALSQEDFGADAPRIAGNGAIAPPAE